MSKQSEPGIAKERDIAMHVLTTSSVMPGLCLMFISVIHNQKKLDTLETPVTISLQWMHLFPSPLAT